MVAGRFGPLQAAKDFVYITDNTYSKDELLQMECTMLAALEFQVRTSEA